MPEDSPFFFMREFSNEELAILFADKVKQLKSVNQQLGLEKKESQKINNRLQKNLIKLETAEDELRKQSEKLKESVNLHQAAERKYLNLYEQCPDMCRTINLDGMIIDCNQSYVKQLGYTKEEVVGKSIFDFIPDNAREVMTESFETWKKTGEVINKEILLKKRDGSVFPALVSATYLYDENGNIVGSNSIIKDISDLRYAQNQIEQLKMQRLAEIGELSSRLAHDLRNPLSILINTMILMKKKSKNPDDFSPRLFDRMERAIEKMSHQVNGVMSFVKVVKPKFENASILYIIKSSIENIEVPDNITISLPEEDVELRCDPLLLEVVFDNLLTNAIQAIKDKGEIRIRIKNLVNNILIDVEDTGEDISQENLPKLFEPLFTTKQRGTGLGLVSCKNIVEQHGGKLIVKINPKVFTLKLPMKLQNYNVSN